MIYNRCKRMSVKEFCNICGLELWHQNGNYHCELCERPDVFGRVKIGKCWKEIEGKMCGHPVVEIPHGWWGSRCLPGRKTQAGHGITICRTCKCNDSYYKSDKEFLSIAHLLAGEIYNHHISKDELEFSWPEPFIDRVMYLVNHWNNEGCNIQMVIPMLILI